MHLFIFDKISAALVSTKEISLKKVKNKLVNYFKYKNLDLKQLLYR